MFEIPLLLILIVLVALVFDFTNGAHDCANAIATVVSTKVVTPRFAVGMAAALNLAGALLGTEVAKTLGAGLVLPEVVQGSHILVLAALLGAIFWNCLTWYFGIPSSSSHALIGGLVGAALAHAGPDALNFAGIVNKVLPPLVLVWLGVPVQMDKMVIGAIMLLVPGIAITNVIRDVLAGDFLTALTKFAEVLIISMALALGIAIPVGISRLLMGVL